MFEQCVLLYLKCKSVKIWKVWKSWNGSLFVTGTVWQCDNVKVQTFYNFELLNYKCMKVWQREHMKVWKHERVRQWKSESVIVWWFDTIMVWKC